MKIGFIVFRFRRNSLFIDVIKFPLMFVDGLATAFFSLSEFTFTILSLVLFVTRSPLRK
jgi:hypothetical protein